MSINIWTNASEQRKQSWLCQVIGLIFLQFHAALPLSITQIILQGFNFQQNSISKKPENHFLHDTLVLRNYPETYPAGVGLPRRIIGSEFVAFLGNKISSQSHKDCWFFQRDLEVGRDEGLESQVMDRDFGVKNERESVRLGP